MAGGGKKVVSVATAVFNAAKHAYGALKGFVNTFSGVYDSFKKAYDTAKNVYDNTIGWVKEHLKPLYDAYNKLRELYDKNVKPILDWVEKTTRELRAAFYAFRGKIWKALNELDRRTFGWIKDLYNRVDNVLRNIQDLASAFSQQLASSIQNLRDQLRRETIGRINEIEKMVFDAVYWLDRMVLQRFETILAWADRHVVKTKKSIDQVLDDIDAALGIDRKPKGRFTREGIKRWGWLLAEDHGSRHFYLSRPEPEAVIPLGPRLAGEGANPMIPLFRDEVDQEPSYGLMVFDEVEAEKDLRGREASALSMMYAALTDAEREFWDLAEVDPRPYWGEWEDLVQFEEDEVISEQEIDRCPIWQAEEKERRPKPTAETPPEMSGEQWFEYYGYEAPPE